MDNLIRKIEKNDFSVAGISLTEIAILGAAGIVIWKNRENIRKFLEEKDIKVPKIFNGEFSELLQSGMELFNHSRNRNDRSSTGGSKARRNH